LLLGNITTESIQAVLPGVSKGLGGNQRASPFVFKFCLLKGYLTGNRHRRLLPFSAPPPKRFFGLPYAVID
jgi:hypothetical protein